MKFRSSLSPSPMSLARALVAGIQARKSDCDCGCEKNRAALTSEGIQGISYFPPKGFAGERDTDIVRVRTSSELSFASSSNDVPSGMPKFGTIKNLKDVPDLTRQNHNPDPSEDGTGWGEGPYPEEEDVPPPPGPIEYKLQFPAIDCKPLYKLIWWGHRKNCTGTVPPKEFSKVMGDIHYIAYRVTLQARRTLDWMATLNSGSKQVFWNWGKEDTVWSFLWGDNIDARSAGLWYWFGPYYYNSFKYVHDVFKILVQNYEKGPFLPVYNCRPNDDGSEVVDGGHKITATFNKGKFETTLYKGFFHDINHGKIANRQREKSQTVFHEWGHSLFLDLSSPWCKDGPLGKCYQTNVSEIWTKFGSYPRILAFHDPGSALFNNDNFLSWAFSRAQDPQWGECDGPKLLPKTRVPRGISIIR